MRKIVEERLGAIAIEEEGHRRTITEATSFLTPVGRLYVYFSGGDEKHAGCCVDLADADGNLHPVCLVETSDDDDCVPGVQLFTRVWTNMAADEAGVHLLHRNVPNSASGEDEVRSDRECDGRIYCCPACGHEWVEYCDADQYPNYCPECGGAISSGNGSRKIAIKEEK